jgi:hypothetical protein
LRYIKNSLKIVGTSKIKKEIQKMKSLTVCSSLCLILIVSLVGTAYVWSQECTLGPKQGRTIIQLGPSSLCSPIESGSCEGQSDQIFVSQPIPSGTYDVTLESFDYHSSKPGQTQTSESYFLRLLDESDVKIVDTNAISDLLDDQDILVQKVNTNLYVGDDIGSIIAIHFCDESTGNNCDLSHNSIRSVCVAFDLHEGGQGCTPGYWKQGHHFDSWTSPYTPETLFSDVFENAFPGKTLLEVLGQGGGHLIALGRHTVAALLNAASPDVSYDLTVQEVIDMFNAVFPGGDYEDLKDQFEDFNEQGCLL